MLYLKIFIEFSISALAISNYDYAIASSVENVHYSTDSTFPCEIALKEGDSENELSPNTYHRSKNPRLCEFAERCRAANLNVKLYGKVMFGLTDVVGIEYANTNAIRH